MCICEFVFEYMFVCMYACVCDVFRCVYVTHTSSASSWGVLPTNDLGVQGASTCMYWNVCVMCKLCMSVCVFVYVCVYVCLCVCR